MTEKKLNFGIDDGDSFFAHEVSVSFNPTQFILDFKCITPRIDPRSNEGPFISMKHNVVIMDVHHARKLLDFYKKRIDEYEKEFGKIEEPKALKMLKKKRKNKVKKQDKGDAPTYFG